MPRVSHDRTPCGLIGPPALHVASRGHVHGHGQGGIQGRALALFAEHPLRPGEVDARGDEREHHQPDQTATGLGWGRRVRRHTRPRRLRRSLTLAVALLFLLRLGGAPGRHGGRGAALRIGLALSFGFDLTLGLGLGLRLTLGFGFDLTLGLGLGFRLGLRFRLAFGFSFGFVLPTRCAASSSALR